MRMWNISDCTTKHRGATREWNHGDGPGDFPRDFKDPVPWSYHIPTLGMVDTTILPGLVNIQKAVENGHRNSGFSHQKWWLSIVFCRFTRGYAIKIWWWLGDCNYGRNDHMTVHKSSEECPSSWPFDSTTITWTSSPKVTVMFSEAAEPTTKINLIWLSIRSCFRSTFFSPPHHALKWYN